MSFSPPKSLKSLRRLAELNLCKECYPKYLALIEGNVEGMLLDSLYNWRSAESIVTQMVMRHKGVFKTRTTVIAIRDNDNPPEDLVDVKGYREVEFWDFSRKLKYLHNNKILPDNCYEALRIAGRIRNKLHTDPVAFRFSERDLQLFARVHQIVSQLQFAEMENTVELRERFRLAPEEYAKRVVQEFNSN
jgi:hypothetical protein